MLLETEVSWNPMISLPMKFGWKRCIDAMELFSVERMMVPSGSSQVFLLSVELSSCRNQIACSTFLRQPEHSPSLRQQREKTTHSEDLGQYFARSRPSKRRMASCEMGNACDTPSPGQSCVPKRTDTRQPGSPRIMESTLNVPSMT